MFIIFGWEKTVKHIESLIKTHCYHCNNDATWYLLKETEWISFFFIKIIPFLSKYRLGCEICGDTLELQTSFAKKIMNPENRNDDLHDEVVSMIESHQFQGLTETQIRWKKSISAD